jgi:hypothetical protein
MPGANADRVREHRVLIGVPGPPDGSARLSGLRRSLDSQRAASAENTA